MVGVPVLLPLAVGPLLWAVTARLSRRRPVAAAAGVAATATVVTVLAAAAAATAAGSSATVTWGPRLVLRLSAGGVASVVGVLVPVVAAPIVAYTAAHERDGLLARLLGLMVAFVGTMELLVFAADLVTLTIAFELVGALSWALIGAEWTDPANPAQATHAFNATRFGGLGLVLAAGAVFAGTGSFSYSAVAELSRPLLDVVAAGVLAAAAAKSAQLPFSPWLFSAMAGPTPVSALLHSATMVAAGAYVVIRLGAPLAATGWFGPAVIGVGLATALAGGLVAAVQNHGKRILAASTSAQYGLMFVAAGAGAAGIAAAHLVAHALFKSLLFLGVGVGMHAVGTADVRAMRLGRALPATAAAFAVGSLALAAVPPLGGAWTKDAVVAAAMDRNVAVGALTLIAGFLSAVYATRLDLLAFGPPTLGGDNFARRAAVPHRPRRTEVAAVSFLAAVSVALGALWLPGAAGRVSRLTGLPAVEGATRQLALSVVLLAVGVGAVVANLAVTGAAELGISGRLREVAADWIGLPSLSRRLVVDPFLAFARLLAAFDDRVVDGGVRLAVGIASGISRLATMRIEWGVDGVVRALAGGATRGARLSRVIDDRAVDGAVEGVAEGVGAAGRRSRSLQTGLTHHYYLIMAGGAVLAALVVAIWR